MIAPVKAALDASGEDYRMLILPDHPTPICVKTHTSNPVPYLLYDSRRQESHDWKYNEEEAMAGGKLVEKGHELMGYLLEV